MFANIEIAGPLSNFRSNIRNFGPILSYPGVPDPVIAENYLKLLQYYTVNLDDTNPHWRSYLWAALPFVPNQQAPPSPQLRAVTTWEAPNRVS